MIIINKDNLLILMNTLIIILSVQTLPTDIHLIKDGRELGDRRGTFCGIMGIIFIIITIIYVAYMCFN